MQCVTASCGVTACGDAAARRVGVGRQCGLGVPLPHNAHCGAPTRTRGAVHAGAGTRRTPTMSAAALGVQAAQTSGHVAAASGHGGGGLLEHLRSGSRQSVTESTPLLLQALREGTSWWEAVDALVDVDAPDRLVTVEASASPKGHGGPPVRAFAAFPASVLVCSEPAPVVVVLHQLFGLRQRDCELCTALSRAGCVAVAPDLHASLPRAPLARLKALAQLDPTARSSLAPLHVLLDWIEQQPWGSQRQSTAVVGSGVYGGGLALNLASTLGEECQAVCTVDGAVIKDLARLACPVLGIFTDDAKRAQAGDVEALLRRSSVPLTVKSLPAGGAGDGSGPDAAAMLDRITAECLKFLESEGVINPTAFACGYGW